MQREGELKIGARPPTDLQMVSCLDFIQSTTGLSIRGVSSTLHFKR